MVSMCMGRCVRMGEVQGIMTDYTQLANEAKAPIPHGECCSCGLCCRTGKINDLADALLACQRERDELAAQEFTAFDLLADVDHEAQSPEWLAQVIEWQQKYYDRIDGRTGE